MRVRRIAIPTAEQSTLLRKDTDQSVGESAQVEARAKLSWQDHAKSLLGAVVVCVALLVGIQLVLGLDHQYSYRPRIVMSDEVRAAMGLDRSRTVKPKINAQQIEALLRVLPTCAMGKKYGALCNDGTVTGDGSEDACADHNGVKAWIECR